MSKMISEEGGAKWLRRCNHFEEMMDKIQSGAGFMLTSYCLTLNSRQPLLERDVKTALQWLRRWVQIHRVDKSLEIYVGQWKYVSQYYFDLHQLHESLITDVDCNFIEMVHNLSLLLYDGVSLVCLLFKSPTLYIQQFLLYVMSYNYPLFIGSLHLTFHCNWNSKYFILVAKFVLWRNYVRD